MILTIGLSNAQETALNRIVAAVNVQRAADTPPLPPVTVDQFIMARLMQLLATYKDQIDAVNKQAFQLAFQEASPATQAQVRILLGL